MEETTTVSESWKGGIASIVKLLLKYKLLFMNKNIILLWQYLLNTPKDSLLRTLNIK